MLLDRRKVGSEKGQDKKRKGERERKKKKKNLNVVYCVGLLVLVNGELEGGMKIMGLNVSSCRKGALIVEYIIIIPGLEQKLDN